jgi:hypothetical protein
LKRNWRGDVCATRHIYNWTQVEPEYPYFKDFKMGYTIFVIDLVMHESGILFHEQVKLVLGGH